MTVKWFNKKSYTKRGQGTLEYILIIALIVIVLFAVIFLLRKQLQNLLNIALRMLNNFMADSGNDQPDRSVEHAVGAAPGNDGIGITAAIGVTSV